MARATLYVHAHKGVHALDKQGEPIWFFPKQDRGPLVAGKSWGWGDETLADPWGWYRSAPLVINGRLYFGSDDGLYALSADCYAGARGTYSYKLNARTSALCPAGFCAWTRGHGLS